MRRHNPQLFRCLHQYTEEISTTPIEFSSPYFETISKYLTHVYHIKYNELLIVQAILSPFLNKILRESSAITFHKNTLNEVVSILLVKLTFILNQHIMSMDTLTEVDIHSARTSIQFITTTINDFKDYFHHLDPTLFERMIQQTREKLDENKPKVKPKLRHSNERMHSTLLSTMATDIANQSQSISDSCLSHLAQLTAEDTTELLEASSTEAMAICRQDLPLGPQLEETLNKIDTLNFAAVIDLKRQATNSIAFWDGSKSAFKASHLPPSEENIVQETTLLRSLSKKLKRIAQQTKIIHSAFLALLTESKDQGDYDRVRSEYNFEFYETYLTEIIQETDIANLNIKTAAQLMDETKSTRKSWLCTLRFKRPWIQSRPEETQTAQMFDCTSADVNADSAVTDHILESLKDDMKANPILA